MVDINTNNVGIHSDDYQQMITEAEQGLNHHQNQDDKS